jgi:response regulator RpfG family c-di-GMP phosphodiesterase/Tfp pilus assembly protein PilF
MIDKVQVLSEIDSIRDTALQIARINHYADYTLRRTPEFSLELAKRAEKAAEQEGLYAEQIRALALIGFNLYMMGKHVQALSTLNEALEIISEHGEIDPPGNIYSTLGLVLHRLGDDKAAARQFNLALTMANLQDDKRVLTSTINNLGNLHYDNGDFDEAYRLYTEALHSAMESGNRDQERGCLSNLGAVYRERGHNGKAMEILEKVLAMGLEEGDLIAQGFALDNIAQTHQAMSEFDQARAKYTHSLDIFERKGLEKHALETRIHLAELYIALGQQAAAEDFIQESLKIAEGNNDEVAQEKLFELEIRVLEMLEDYKGALKSFKRYHKLAARHSKDETSMYIKSLELETYREANSRFRSISEIGKSLTSLLQPDLVVSETYRYVQELINPDVVGIGELILEEERIEYSFSVRGREKPISVSCSIKDRKCIATTCLNDGIEIHLNDIANEYHKYAEDVLDYKLFRQQELSLRPQSLIYIPLFHGTDSIGVLAVLDGEKSAFSRRDMDTMRAFASYVSIALSNARAADLLEKKIAIRTRKLDRAQDFTLSSLAALAETRDSSTGFHIDRTRHYVLHLALELKNNSPYSNQLSEEDITLLYKCAPLHDIGKVGVPDHILKKPGKLSVEEFEIMKEHTRIGGSILSRADEAVGQDHFIHMSRKIVLFHHERWDGAGYPEGLAGEIIPLAGRIMAIADVYDALRSERPYKPALSHQEALVYIRANRGRHFDPVITDIFLANEAYMNRIFNEYHN